MTTRRSSRVLEQTADRDTSPQLRQTASGSHTKPRSGSLSPMNEVSMRSTRSRTGVALQFVRFGGDREKTDDISPRRPNSRRPNRKVHDNGVYSSSQDDDEAPDMHRRSGRLRNQGRAISNGTRQLDDSDEEDQLMEDEEQEDEPGKEETDDSSGSEDDTEERSHRDGVRTRSSMRSRQRDEIATLVEDEFRKKYSFRNRDNTRRDTSFLNIKTLGGDAGGLNRTSQAVPTRVLRRSYSDNSQRFHFGGKLPNWNAKRHKSANRDSFKSVERRRHFDSSSDSSDSSVGDRPRNSSERHANPYPRSNSFESFDEDYQFSHHEMRRLEEERNSIQPINLLTSGREDSALGGSVRDKASKRDLLRADVMPVTVDSDVGFSLVGGLDSHIAALKEMVVLPLLYPDVFDRFKTQPPRGVLFVGPPGTGKTLTARALANSISATNSKGGRKISFFMRKGADCLSKWVGEGERQLRLLFEQVWCSCLVCSVLAHSFY
jgi:hypothetical protein